MLPPDSNGLPSLEACLKTLKAAPPMGQQQFDAASLAAVLCLRLGHSPAKALKFSSKASFLQPQNDAARQLVRDCTRELEYEGRFKALSQHSIEGSPGASAVLTILALLSAEDGAAENPQDDECALLARLAEVRPL